MAHPLYDVVLESLMQMQVDTRHSIGALSPKELALKQRATLEWVMMHHLPHETEAHADVLRRMPAWVLREWEACVEGGWWPQQECAHWHMLQLEVFCGDVFQILDRELPHAGFLVRFDAQTRDVHVSWRCPRPSREAVCATPALPFKRWEYRRDGVFCATVEGVRWAAFTWLPLIQQTAHAALCLHDVLRRCADEELPRSVLAAAAALAAVADLQGVADSVWIEGSAVPSVIVDGRTVPLVATRGSREDTLVRRARGALWVERGVVQFRLADACWSGEKLDWVLARLADALPFTPGHAVPGRDSDELLELCYSAAAAATWVDVDLSPHLDAPAHELGAVLARALLSALAAGREWDALQTCLSDLQFGFRPQGDAPRPVSGGGCRLALRLDCTDAFKDPVAAANHVASAMQQRRCQLTLTPVTPEGYDVTYLGPAEPEVIKDAACRLVAQMTIRRADLFLSRGAPRWLDEGARKHLLDRCKHVRVVEASVGVRRRLVMVVQ